MFKKEWTPQRTQYQTLYTKTHVISKQEFI